MKVVFLKKWVKKEVIHVHVNSWFWNYCFPIMSKIFQILLPLWKGNSLLSFIQLFVHSLPIFLLFSFPSFLSSKDDEYVLLAEHMTW